MNFQWLPGRGLSEPSVPGHWGRCRLWWITSCPVTHHKWLSAHFPCCEVLIKAPPPGADGEKPALLSFVCLIFWHFAHLASADTGKEHAVPPSQTTQTSTADCNPLSPPTAITHAAFPALWFPSSSGNLLRTVGIHTNTCQLAGFHSAQFELQLSARRYRRVVRGMLDASVNQRIWCLGTMQALAGGAGGEQRLMAESIWSSDTSWSKGGRDGGGLRISVESLSRVVMLQLSLIWLVSHCLLV